MLHNKFVETLLSSADSGDLNAVRDEVVCHSSADATGRTDEKYVFVWERHGASCSGSVFGESLEAARLIIYICMSRSFPGVESRSGSMHDWYAQHGLALQTKSTQYGNVRSGVHTSITSHIKRSVASLLSDL